MNQLASLAAAHTPALIAAAGDRASYRFLEFFAGQIRNANSRRAYLRATGRFLAWLEVQGAKTGATPPRSPAEARQLLDAIDTSTPAGLRDRALISLMVYSLARVGAALGMTVEDAFSKNRRLWVRLLEKGGKRHEMPCHHNLEEYLHAYIDGCGLSSEPKEPLFRTIQGRSGRLTGNALAQSEAYRMIVRRCRAAGIDTKAGNHTFRATGITAYLKAGGTLERAAAMANHASTRTTQLYDRRTEDVTLDEVERIGI